MWPWRNACELGCNQTIAKNQNKVNVHINNVLQAAVDLCRAHHHQNKQNGNMMGIKILKSFMSMEEDAAYYESIPIMSLE